MGCQGVALPLSSRLEGRPRGDRDCRPRDERSGDPGAIHRDDERSLRARSRVVFVTVHLPAYYSWSKSVNATLEEEVPKYPEDRLADFNKLADKNPQWFGPDGVHMPIGGAGAQAMAKLIKSQI